MALWVHVAVPGESGVFDPPAPQAIPHRGYRVLRVAFCAYELQFSALAQLDHFIDVLARKPLPKSRQLSIRRGVPMGPNSHWLSRLPAKLKSPRMREKLVRALIGIRPQAAAEWSNASLRRNNSHSLEAAS